MRGLYKLRGGSSVASKVPPRACESSGGVGQYAALFPMQLNSVCGYNNYPATQPFDMDSEGHGAIQARNVSE